MGLLTSGGSMATLTALGVARHTKAGVDARADGLRNASACGFYVSSQGHSCVRKAVELLGFGSESMRTLGVDADSRMDVAALDRALERDRRDGVQPIAVVASMGTTNTGAIDDLEAIADVCSRHGVWFHVDAAYGGPAVLLPEYAAAARGLARAHSVALDPHKWMFVPVEAGFVAVRDADAMRSTFSLVPPYIRSAGSPTGVYGLPWFSEYGFQQTRGFRALKVWMTVKHAGLDGIRDAIAENISLARYLADRVRATPELELAATPALSVVCFCHRGGADLNRALLERVQLSGEAFLTSTELDGRFVLRTCIVNFRSTRGDIDRMIETVVRIGGELTSATVGASR
jgi:glutamate/tyrosine decarboxylase-like PLP-dependent enzyme